MRLIFLSLHLKIGGFQCMRREATKPIVLGIMKQRKEWFPHEVVSILNQHKIFVSQSTLERQFRRWEEIKSVEPKDRKKRRS